MSEKLSLNEAIQFLSQLKSRISNLTSLRTQCAVEKHYYGEKESVSTPKYDVVKLDQKITSIENWLWKIEAHVKSINAKTRIEMDVPVDELLKALE